MRSTLSTRAARRPAVRMRRRRTASPSAPRRRRRPGCPRPGGCSVMISPRRVSTSARETSGASTMSASSASTGSKSSTRQVQTSDSACRLTVDGQRDAAAVELLGDLIARCASSVPRSIVRRHEVRDAGAVRRIVDRARREARRDGDGRRRRRLLGEHGTPLASTLPRRRETRVEATVGIDESLLDCGSNQPTVRFDRRQPRAPRPSRPARASPPRCASRSDVNSRASWRSSRSSRAGARCW